MIRLLPPPKSDEDLFRESTMTFGEHLEELRQCLFRALWGLAVGVVIGLIFGNWVVMLIQQPLEKALTEHYIRLSQRQVAQQIKALRAAGVETPFTEDAASQFVVSKQVLAEEYLISPRELMVQFASALQAMRKRWEDDQNALLTLRKHLQSGESLPQDAKLLTRLSHGFEVLASRWPAMLGDSEAAPSGKSTTLLSLKEIATLKGKFLSGESITEEARKKLIDALGLVSGQIEKGIAALSREHGELAGLAGAALLEPGRVDDSEFMHVFLWRPAKEDPRVRARSLSAHEAFAIYMKASFLFGAIISSPWVFYQIWSFVAAGLYRHERRFVYIFLPFSLGLFLAGAALAFLYVFEPVLTFLFQFNDWLGIQLEPRISEWLSFVLILPLGFGIGFQLPLVMLFLERIGIFTLQDYWSQWRIAVVVIFIIAAILTPPDPSSQLLMAIPLCLLYFGGMALCKFFPRNITAAPRGRSQAGVA